MEVLNKNVALLDDEVLHNETKQLWVFGYGSLCWKPGFEFHKAVTGFIQGYTRRFWQGNTTHRGTKDRPGRVATLVEDDKGMVHGVSYAVSGEAAIPYLTKRECELGDYKSQFTTFYPSYGEPFKVLLYIAMPTNRLWLGDGDMEDVATQIVQSSGPSGHNIEYLVRLANFMRQTFPEHKDEYLFTLEYEVRKQIQEKKMCLESVMGSGEGCITFIKTEHHNHDEPPEEVQERPDSFQFTTKVPEKVLRCLNI